MTQHATAADHPGDQVNSTGERARKTQAPKARARESRPENTSADRGSHQQVLFITGLFRSGTTILWHLLRQFETVQGYFEPLHDNLIASLSAAAAPDPVHVGVEDYYAEYRPFLEDVQRRHRPEFGVSRLCLGGADSHPRLRDYLDFLVARAEDRFPVFKMMRDDFRLPWLKRQFPEATVIYIRRNPRDVWASVVRHAPEDQRAASWLNTGFDLLIWSANLCPYFSPICSSKISHSYERVYVFWRISTALADRYADLIIDFDMGLQADPAATIERLATCVGQDVGDIASLAKLVTPRQGGEWREYEKESLLKGIEDDCDAALAESGLLDRIAEGELDGTWPIADPPTRGGDSDLAGALCQEVSLHRSALIINKNDYERALRHAERTARALERDLEKLRADSASELAARDKALSESQGYAASLKEEIKKLQADSASELAARDRALAESRGYAASLKDEVKKLWADGASELAARDEAIAECQDYARLLRRDLANSQAAAKALKQELSKVGDDSVAGLEARDTALAESQAYATSLVAELHKVRTDAERGIEARDAALIESQTYARSLKAELEKVQEQLEKAQAELAELQERALVRLGIRLNQLLGR